MVPNLPEKLPAYIMARQFRSVNNKKLTRANILLERRGEGCGPPPPLPRLDGSGNAVPGRRGGKPPLPGNGRGGFVLFRSLADEIHRGGASRGAGAGAEGCANQSITFISSHGHRY